MGFQSATEDFFCPGICAQERSSIQHCGARQQAVLILLSDSCLGPPRSKRLASRLEVSDRCGQAGIHGLTMFWKLNGPEPFAARWAGISDLSLIRTANDSQRRMGMGGVVWETWVE